MHKYLAQNQNSPNKRSISMNYDDNLLADKNASVHISKDFYHIQSQNINELKEIVHKMNMQKTDLIADNNGGKYDILIKKMSQNIADLEKVISNHFKQNLSPNKNYFAHKFNLQNFILSPNRLSPVRSREEMIAHGDYVPNNSDNVITPNENSTNIPNNNESLSPNLENNLSNPVTDTPNTPNNNGLPLDLVNNSDSLVSPPTGKTRTNNIRRRPLRSNFFATFAKKLNLNLFNLNNRLSTHNANLVDKSQNQFKFNNRFHNVEILYHECNHVDYLKSNQINIIRLLILYLTICPTCRHHSLIAEIANCQFDIFLSL